jgi:enolase-phosphatase E1
VSVVLLDIEGTTTPIDFVYQTLFPYARQRVADYVQTNGHVPEVQADIARLEAEWGWENPSAPGLPRWNTEQRMQSATTYLLWLMDQDRKSPALKSVQGKIWQAGYESGEIQGQVFEDVPRFLREWQSQGRRTFIFSSGSILAQQLLFRHSEHGDLTSLIAGYFDTTTGSKQAPQSYEAIIKAINAPPAAICFVSDVPAELAAAEIAGIRPLLSVRPGNAPVSSERYPVIDSFDGLLPALLR